jgi:hypothetical protein
MDDIIGPLAQQPAYAIIDILCQRAHYYTFLTPQGGGLTSRVAIGRVSHVSHVTLLLSFSLPVFTSLTFTLCRTCTNLPAGIVFRYTLALCERIFIQENCLSIRLTLLWTYRKGLWLCGICVALR